MQKEIPQNDKVQPEKMLSNQDHEEMARAFLNIGEEKMAKSHFSAAGWTEENIQKILKNIDAKKTEIPDKKMGVEEKKELLEKMAKEFEEDSERAGTEERKKIFKEMAESYRRELERMEKEQSE